MFRVSTIVLLALCVCAWMAGCSSNNSPSPSSQPETQTDGHGHEHPEEEAHVHANEGPHGGHLIELGSEYCAELLHDENTDAVTVHILDRAAKESVLPAQSEVTFQLLRDGRFVQYTLKAVPGEAEGKASEFTVVDASLCEALGQQEQVRGRLHVTIEGNQLTGMIEHEGHDHSDH